MIFVSNNWQVYDSVRVAHQPDTVIKHTEPVRIVVMDSTLRDTGSNIPVSSVTAFPKASLTKIIHQEPAKPVRPSLIMDDALTEKWNTGRNFLMENGLTGVIQGIADEQPVLASDRYTSTTKPSEILVHHRSSFRSDWLTGIFLLLVILFIWIRMFYNRYFSTLANALMSFQFSALLFNEKNVLLNRVSVVLDFVYITVFTTFLYELIRFTGWNHSKLNGFSLFLLLMNVIILYTVFRLLVIRLTGTLFMAKTIFSEYLHNLFVINKGLGIALFPVIIMVQYFPHAFVPFLLILGSLVFSAAFLIKGIRAYQIIIRRKVFIFYMILYLCTLEILPFLLGYKFVKTLILSN